MRDLDNWKSAGTLFELCIGAPPTLSHFKQPTQARRLPERFPVAIRGCVEQCLAYDATSRPEAHEIFLRAKPFVTASILQLITHDSSHYISSSPNVQVTTNQTACPTPALPGATQILTDATASRNVTATTITDAHDIHGISINPMNATLHAKGTSVHRLELGGSSEAPIEAITPPILPSFRQRDIYQAAFRNLRRLDSERSSLMLGEGIMLDYNAHLHPEGRNTPTSFIHTSRNSPRRQSVSDNYSSAEHSEWGESRLSLGARQFIEQSARIPIPSNSLGLSRPLVAPWNTASSKAAPEPDWMPIGQLVTEKFSLRSLRDRELISVKLHGRTSNDNKNVEENAKKEYELPFIGLEDKETGRAYGKPAQRERSPWDTGTLAGKPITRYRLQIPKADRPQAVRQNQNNTAWLHLQFGKRTRIYLIIGAVTYAVNLRRR